MLAPDAVIPLAARMRPASIEQYLGQYHLLSEGKPLRKMLDQNRCHSMILWGPPGTGKTTLAKLIGKHVDANMITLSAVTSGVKEIRAVMQEAENSQHYGQRTLLFIDEIHRFNKAQQDAFLPYVESGAITLIGATTENPAFELNRALLSRARVYILNPIDANTMATLIRYALSDEQNGLGTLNLAISDKALTALTELCDGDARRCLNVLELASDLCESGEISVTDIEQASGNKLASYDKGGDAFYDLISAFHKSVRGSDPDAALYWYARILQGGGDALYVARRLLAIASEDIGNADPRALQLSLNAWDTFHRVGPAEGERAIAQAAVYCALAAKSNAVYQAFAAAQDAAREHPTLPVPPHLRNAPTQLAKQQGHGAEYRYAHNEEYAFAAGECYFPEGLQGMKFYYPNERGLEKSLLAKREYLDQLNAASKQKRYK